MMSSNGSTSLGQPVGKLVWSGTSLAVSPAACWYVPAEGAVRFAKGFAGDKKRAEGVGNAAKSNGLGIDAASLDDGSGGGPKVRLGEASPAAYHSPPSCPPRALSQSKFSRPQESWLNSPACSAETPPCSLTDLTLFRLTAEDRPSSTSQLQLSPAVMQFGQGSGATPPHLRFLERHCGVNTRRPPRRRILTDRQALLDRLMRARLARGSSESSLSGETSASGMCDVTACGSWPALGCCPASREGPA